MIWTDTGLHVAVWDDSGWFNGDIYLTDDMGGLPTHWMPRPAPPSATKP